MCRPLNPGPLEVCFGVMSSAGGCNHAEASGEEQLQGSRLMVLSLEVLTQKLHAIQCSPPAQKARRSVWKLCSSRMLIELQREVVAPLLFPRLLVIAACFPISGWVFQFETDFSRNVERDGCD